MWRKTRSNWSGSDRCTGVDGNRNYGYEFGGKIEWLNSWRGTRGGGGVPNSYWEVLQEQERWRI